MIARTPVVVVAVLAVLVLAAPGFAAERAPLLVEGKTTVFQRVLTKPDAMLHAEPDGAVTNPLRPFQPLYVYGRRDDAWIEVGRGRATGPEGWIPAERTVEWHQNIVVSFSNPAGRERQLMFESQNALMAVVRHEAPIGVARELRQQAVAGGAGAAPGVATIEPEEHIDITRNFYLFPILDWQMEEHPMTFELIRVLRLASLPLETATPVEAEETPPTAGVAFVIDTTRSMQPYIEATRNAVAAIVDRIRDSEVGASIRFAAIGFRDSPEAARAVDPARDIEYRTRLFLPLDPDQGPAAVNASFAAIEEARQPTLDYHEDALSGVWQAINMPQWETAGDEGGPIKQRYVVVISDASPKPPGDPSLEPDIRDLDPASVLERARSKQITLAAIHLKAPDGQANHRAAEAAYSQMTQSPTSGRPLYYPVDLAGAADPAAAFRPVVDEVANFVIGEYRRTARELMEAQQDRELTPLEEASLAMRLAWLGRERDTGAPEIIEAWAIDRALENPLIPALDVRLLVTKNQISTMADVLREILTLGETTQGEMRQGEFFDLLRGALARIAQDPDNLVDTEYGTLDEAVGEFLGDLPYQSPILENITAEKWQNMGPQRRVVLDRVRARLQLYEHYHDDPALWTALYEGAPESEHVFAMPFESLP